MVAKKLGKENDLCREWRIENRQNQQAKDATLKPCNIYGSLYSSTVLSLSSINEQREDREKAWNTM